MGGLVSTIKQPQPSFTNSRPWETEKQ